MTLGIGIVALGLIGTVYADSRESIALRWVFKPLASIGFIVIAFAPLARGAEPSALHAGLVLAALGDIALVSRSKRLLMVGLGCFALAHVAYIAYFLSVSVRTPGGATVVVGVASLVVLMVVGHRIWTWLEPHTGSMRSPVRVYVLLVSLMATSAVTASTVPGAAVLLAPLGGVLLYLSDLSVARDRFIEHSFANKLWGLPLYYVGQVLIAIAAAG